MHIIFISCAPLKLSVWLSLYRSFRGASDKFIVLIGIQSSCHPSSVVCVRRMTACRLPCLVMHRMSIYRMSVTCLCRVSLSYIYLCRLLDVSIACLSVSLSQASVVCWTFLSHVCRVSLSYACRVLDVSIACICRISLSCAHVACLTGMSLSPSVTRPAIVSGPAIFLAGGAVLRPREAPDRPGILGRGRDRVTRRLWQAVPVVSVMSPPRAVAAAAPLLAAGPLARAGGVFSAARQECRRRAGPE